MNENKPYKCVNCGEPAAALFKTYGPSVLKLTKCDKCKGIVDKYIEYDPVIVMIDLVLMSKEAQRHVLYNTEFKMYAGFHTMFSFIEKHPINIIIPSHLQHHHYEYPYINSKELIGMYLGFNPQPHDDKSSSVQSYWKLLIVLIMLETYGVWRSDSLFNIAINSVCGTRNNSTANSSLLNLPVVLTVPASWRNSSNCEAWARDQKGDDADLFIWEKDFYIKFISIFAGIAAFILTAQSSMKILKPITTQSEVSSVRLLKAFSLGNVSVLFALPMLVWGNTDTAAETRGLHYALVFLYSAGLFLGLLTVLYECPLAVTILVLTVSNIAKYSTSFYITPYLKNFIT